MAERRSITVVVPVYGDAPSLLACVRSLIETVDTARDQVMLVNDCGPDADTIERELLALITGLDGFQYERNPHNLGFVGACNRAALELDSTGNDVLLLNSDTVVTAGWLDELGEVLHADERHGVVCARSTNATIASLPFRLRDPRSPRVLARSLAVRSALISRLPRWSYPPVAMGFCFLIRRELLDRFGLFDEVFAPGYGEENDFCLRVGREGYLSVMAHRALVVHEGARSFLDARRARLRAEHERILVGRHPDYPARVRDYLWCAVDPLDAFADALVPSMSVGADDRGAAVVLVPKGDPTPAWTALAAADADTLGLTVLVSPRSARAWRRAVGDARVLTFGAEEGRVWDLAVSDAAPGTEAALRAGHAAPRLLPLTAVQGGDARGLIPAAHAPVDDVSLRERWNADAERMRRVGIPPAPVPSARQRLRAVLDRRAPRLAGIARRALRR